MLSRKEPTIVINGISLSNAETSAIRVAVAHLMTYATDPGNNDLGEIALIYRDRLMKIERLMGVRRDTFTLQVVATEVLESDASFRRRIQEIRYLSDAETAIGTHLDRLGWKNGIIRHGLELSTIEGKTDARP